VSAHIALTPRKPIDVLPEAARRFVEDTSAFFAENNTIKDDGIAPGNCTRSGSTALASCA
jgi:hypothetical protein